MKRGAGKKKADGIQREYLLRKLNRMKRDYAEADDALEAIDELITWVKAQRARAKKPGGLGK